MHARIIGRVAGPAPRVRLERVVAVLPRPQLYRVGAHRADDRLTLSGNRGSGGALVGAMRSVFETERPAASSAREREEVFLSTRFHGAVGSDGHQVHGLRIRHWLECAKNK